MNSYYRSAQWSVTIQRPDYTKGRLTYLSPAEWNHAGRARFVSSSEQADGWVSYTDMISYEYSNSISDPTGQFSLTLVPRQDKNGLTWKDKIRSRDIVTITEFGKVRYIGVVTGTGYTMSMPSGRPSRSVTISGMSLGGLLATYNVVMNLFLWPQGGDADTANLQLMAALNSNIDQDQDISTVFDLIVQRFFRVTFGASVVGFKPILDSFFSLNVEDIAAKYPMRIMPFQTGENNLWSIARQILPAPVYEVFGRYIGGKYELTCRETPFDTVPWNALKENVLNPVFLVNQSLSDSDGQVYTHYFSQLPNAVLSENETYADSAINEVAVFDEERLPIYGYKQLQMSFPFMNLDETEGFDSREFLKYNSARLYAWYRNNAEFQSGSITLMTVPDENGDYPDIGEKLKYLQGDTGKIYFYIEGVKREMRYPQAMTSTYTVTRGFEYGSNSVTISGITLSTPQLKPITGMGRKLIDAEKNTTREAG